MSGLRRFIQIIFSIIAIFVLIGSISLFYPVPYVSAFVGQTIIGNYWPSIVIAAILLLISIVCLGAFLYALLAPAKLDELVIETEHGELSFTKNAIESAALRSIRHLSAAKNAQAKAILIKNPENTQIRIKFEIDTEKDIIALGKQVQNSVKNAIETTLGIPVKAVEVEIKQIEPAFARVSRPQTTDLPRVQ